MPLRTKTGRRTPPTGKRGKSGKAPGSRLTPAEVEEISRRNSSARALTPRPSFATAIPSPFSSPWCYRRERRPPVDKATPDLFKVADTPEKLIELGEAKLTEKIKTIGLYRSKARNLIALSRKIIDEFDGKVPGTREALVTCPASAADRQCRTQRRLQPGDHRRRHPSLPRGVPHRTCPRQDALEVGSPRSSGTRTLPHGCHRWLILHGRYVCKARKPECWRCLINDICLYDHKTTAIDTLDAPKASSACPTCVQQNASERR